MADQGWKEVKFRVGDTDLQVINGGTGKPLLVLHGELGFPGWLKWHTALAQKRTLYIPLHPGFGKTPLADWIMDVRDLGGLLLALYSRAEAGAGGRHRLFAGRLSCGRDGDCELAQFNKMILVGAAGLRPPTRRNHGHVQRRPRAPFSTRTCSIPDRPSSSRCSAASRRPSSTRSGKRRGPRPHGLRGSRIMFTQSMAHLLENVAGLPTLLMWGKQDRGGAALVGELYHQTDCGLEAGDIGLRAYAGGREAGRFHSRSRGLFGLRDPYDVVRPNAAAVAKHGAFLIEYDDKRNRVEVRSCI